VSPNINNDDEIGSDGCCDIMSGFSGDGISDGVDTELL